MRPLFNPSKTQSAIRLPLNDSGCGWINMLPPRDSVKTLSRNESVDWLVVGAGYTGLAFARRLAAHYPERSIILLDGQRAGEGAAGRNSGFAVDVSTNRSNHTEAMRRAAKQSYSINMEGIDYLRELVQTHNIDCDWDANGKIHSSAEPRNCKSFEYYRDVLEAAEVPYEMMDADALKRRLGIDYYHAGIWTKHAVLLQPAALARGLALSLPENVRLLEDSPVERIDYGSTIKAHCGNGEVSARNVAICTNGLLPNFGCYQNRMITLTLTASLTRPLTSEEQSRIGNPKPWGILSGHPTGATVRYTADHRILIRNTAEHWPRQSMTEAQVHARRLIHESALRARWPMLPDLQFEHSWSGLISMSRNSSSAFGKLDSNVYTAGCYNAGGIAKGTALGKLLADMVAGESSETLSHALNMETPALMPPRPYLDIGAALKIVMMKRGVGRDA